MNTKEQSTQAMDKIGIKLWVRLKEAYHGLIVYPRWLSGQQKEPMLTLEELLRIKAQLE